MSEFESPPVSRAHPPASGSAGVRATLARPARDARRGWRIVGHSVGALACLLFMLLGTLFGHFYWGSATFSDMVKRHGIGVVLNTIWHRDPLLDWTPEKQFPYQTSLNVLILGVDKDYDHRGRVIKDAYGRSDTILLARVDFVNETISALTIPRDTAVRIPGRRGISKINAAHAMGGPEKTIETIRAVFGIPVDAWVSLNFEAFQKIVDAIGGIDINVEKQLDYDDNWGNLHIHLKPGYQRLNGYEAMGYVRMRHSDSDFMRAKRQHNFLEALRTKLKQPGTFLALPKVLDTVNENIKRGALTEDQMFALANFARNLPKERIVIETLPSREGPSFVTIDREKGAEVIQRLFFPNQMVTVSIDAPTVSSSVRTGRRFSRRSRARAEDAGTIHAEQPSGEEATEPETTERADGLDPGDSGSTETPPEGAPPPSPPDGDAGGEGGQSGEGAPSGAAG